MTLLELLTLSAASWYIAFAVTSTSGPFHVFEWIRGHIWHGRTKTAVYNLDNNNKMVFERFHNGLLDCIICFVLWVSIGLRLLYALVNHQDFSFNMLFEGVAIAGVSLWIHAYSSWVHIGGDKDA